MPHCHREALAALASFYDIQALRDIAGLAADPGYAHRAAAVSTLAGMSDLWQEQAEPYWLALAADETIDAVVQYARHVSRHPSPRGQTFLATLLESSSPEVRERAKARRLVTRGGVVEIDIPEGLDIRIATDRPSYRYNAPATLTVELANSGAEPITLRKHLFRAPDLTTEYLDLDFVMPNGDRRAYLDHDRSPDWLLGQAHVHQSAPPGRLPGSSSRTLDPGESIVVEIDMRATCRPAQPGVYRAQLVYGRPSHSEPHHRAAGEPAPTISSNWVEFEVKPPSDEQVARLISRLDVDSLTDKSSRAVMRICYMLGELGDPRAIDALRDVALLGPQRRRLRNRRHMAGHAIRALAKFDASETAHVWLDMLDVSFALATERLVQLGDRRAIEPLRARALNSGDVVAAKALAELGDDSVIRFLRSEALRDADPADESTWGVSKALALLLPGENLADRLSHEHPAARGQAIRTASKEGRTDVLTMALQDADARSRRQAAAALANSAGESDGDLATRASVIDALKRAIADSDHGVQRAAAGALARLGDSSGESLLREELTAREYETRVAARGALRSLRRGPG